MHIVDKLSRAQSAHSRLSGLLQASEARVADLEAQLEAAEAEKADLAAEIDGLKKQLRDAKKAAKPAPKRRTTTKKTQGA